MSPALVLLLVAVGAVLVAVALLLAGRPVAGLALLPLGAAVAPPELPLLSGAVNGAHLLALTGVGVVVLHLLLTPARAATWSRPVPAAVAVAVVAAALYAVTVLAAALTGPFLTTHLGVTVTTLLAIAYAGCVVLVVRSERDVRFLLGCFVIGSVGVTAPALLQAGGVESQLAGAVVTGRATGGFGDPNELGIFSALCVVASAGFVATATGRWRWVAVLAGVVAFAALLLSFSRLSWIATTVGVLLLLAHPSYRRLLVRRVAPVVAVGLGVAFALGARFPVTPLLDRLSSVGGAVNPDDQRPLIWQEAVRLFLERPVLGWGPGAYESLTDAPPSPLWFGVATVNHPHNGLLTVLVEQGVLGAVAVLVLLAALVWGLVGAYRAAVGSTTATLAWGLGAVVATLLVNLTVDYALRNAFVMLTVWFLLGLCVAFAASARRPGDAGHEVLDPPQRQTPRPVESR